MTQTSHSDTRHLAPGPEGTAAEQAIVDGPQQVTTEPEQIQHDAVHRQEPLRVRGRFEPSHEPLAVPCGLVGDFGAIVLVPIRTVSDGRHDRSVRSSVAAQLVGDQSPRLRY